MINIVTIGCLLYFLWLKTTGNDRAVSRTEAIWKLTVGCVASLSQVRRWLGDWCWSWKWKDIDVVDTLLMTLTENYTFSR